MAHDSHPEPAVPTGTPDVDTLREAVAELVIRTSTRAAAEEIGLSSSRLNTFVNGKPLGAQALLLVQDWYRNSLARGNILSAAVSADGPSVTVLRQAVQDAVLATSIRAVAEQADVSKSLVEVFLKPGSKPHERTVRVFRRWYAGAAHRAD